MQYGLIGGVLGHSYSKQVHNILCDYNYQLCPLPTPQQAHAFLQKREFCAINVTIPYKQLALPYCAVLDANAKAIGAVNTIVNRGGILHGYNTDYDGFSLLCQTEGVCFAGRTVLILGTGGTAKTMAAVATNGGARQILFASRTPRAGQLSYADAARQQAVEIILNASPVGMFPHNGDCLLDLGAFPNLAAVLDAVYNPLCTALVLQARKRGIPAAGGLLMLVAQAAYAAQYFCGAEIPPHKIFDANRQIWRSRANICLVGMPSSGKTTIGKQLATLLHRPFVDVDAEIERAAGKPIPQIFETEGEAAFRRLERQQLAQICAQTGQVVSTGGGAVLLPQNIDAMRQNGLVLYIDRPVQGLKIGGDRPLSASKQALHQLAAQRLPLYRAAADITIPNHGALFQAATDAAKEAICAYFDTKRP